MPYHAPPTRGLAVLCAVLFLAAGGAVPFIAHDCPHHDRAVAPESGAHQMAVGIPRDSGAHDSGSHDSDGPCTCVGACHASADTPVLPNSDRPVSTASFSGESTGALSGEGSPLGPRHPRFALHLPNAPPASL